ncbi:MAG: hypothetical protein RSC98_03960 [Clostridia bacterium]
MKKHKLLFLSLILVVGILPAYAEGTDWKSIQQIKQSTPNAWQQVYETPWRTISIDAKVIVPNVDAVPILRVSYLTPRPEEKLSRYDRVCHNNDRCFYGIVGSNPQDQMDSKYIGNSAFRHVAIFPAGESPKQLPENNPLPYQEARKIADTEFRQLYGYGLEAFDDWESYVFSRMVATSKGEQTDQYVTEQGYYWLRFKQSFAGIPFNACDLYTREGGGKPLGGRGELLIEVTDANNFMVITTHLETKDQPYADVPLLSFAQAKGAMEEKIRSGYIREIERVELCYAPYNDPTDDSILWLLPVWRAHCVIDENPEYTAKIGTNKHGEILDERIWSDVVFEAQRGALMNPLDASKKRRNVPTMMTWDDAKRY